jgi:hypothetical protein
MHLAVRRVGQMWKSSVHMPPVGRGELLACTGGSFYSHPAVHEDEVKNFIASEFSQWLGEKYEVEGRVYTGSLLGKAKRLIEYNTKKLSLDDAEKRLVGYEKDLKQHRERGSSSSSGGKKHDPKFESELLHKIKEVENYIAKLKIEKEYKAKKAQMVYRKPANNNAAKPVHADHNHHAHHLLGGRTEDEPVDDADPHGYTSIPQNVSKNSSVRSNDSQGPPSLRIQNHTTNYNTI